LAIVADWVIAESGDSDLVILRLGHQSPDRITTSRDHQVINNHPIFTLPSSMHGTIVGSVS
jgi:hypothetical protein